MGRLNTATSEAETATKDLILNRPARGQCVICTEQTLINEDIDVILNHQKRHINRINEALEQRYP